MLRELVPGIYTGQKRAVSSARSTRRIARCFCAWLRGRWGARFCPLSSSQRSHADAEGAREFRL